MTEVRLAVGRWDCVLVSKDEVDKPVGVVLDLELGVVTAAVAGDGVRLLLHGEATLSLLPSSILLPSSPNLPLQCI